MKIENLRNKKAQQHTRVDNNKINEAWQASGFCSTASGEEGKDDDSLKRNLFIYLPRLCL